MHLKNPLTRLPLILDRLVFLIFTRRHYRERFAQYGEDVRWGKHSLSRCIPASVRISCPDKIRIGNGCQIDEGVYLQCHEEGDGIVIGDGTRINAHVHVLAYSQVVVGSHVLIAPFTLIASGDHGHGQRGIPIMHQRYEKSGEITIGDGTWIGQGAKILGGAHIGRYSVVGAGAVVKGSFDDGSIIAGVPAKCVRSIV
jgi:acetyltransferase-like isoleucine patch superfamily enzyme